MVEADLYDMVLNEINHQLEVKGVIVKCGAIVGTSITDTPRRPRGRKEYEMIEDCHEKDEGGLGRSHAQGNCHAQCRRRGLVGQEDGKVPLRLQAPYGN